MLRATCAFVCLLSGIASAQESQPSSAPAPQNQPTPAVTLPRDEPAPQQAPGKPPLAFAASLGGMALGSGLVILGVDSLLDTNVEQGKALGVLGLFVLSVGPSAGHVYAKDYKHAGVFSGIRLATTGLTLLGLKISADGALELDLQKNATGNALATISGVALVSFALYDVADAPFSPKRSKEKLFAWRISPAPIATASSNLAPGAALSAKW